jgi:hypothetical protein
MVTDLTRKVFSVRKESMQRTISIFLSCVFLLWLLPLGVFISPSKEKLLCDGQRAVCLCSHASSVKAKNEDAGKTMVKAVSPAQKESSSSSGNFYLAPRSQNNVQYVTRAFFLRHKNFYNLVVSKPVEHVPKV